MGQFQPKTRDYILRRMINRVVARSELTDLNDLSDVKQILAASAREDDDAYVQMVALLDTFDIFTAVGNDLDERAKQFNPRLVKRNTAIKASGPVQFSRTATVGTITVPVGTQVLVPAAGGQAALVYITTAVGTILDTFTTSAAVNVEAAVAGTTGNVGVNAITGFGSKPAGVQAVGNVSAFTNGTDREADESFRRRIISQVTGLARAHVSGIEAALLQTVDPVSGKRVLFANVVENAIQRGNVTAFIDDGSGTAETSTPVTTQVVLASAVGGETVLNLPHKPIKIENTFILRRNAVPLVVNTDYTLNPASGQINLMPVPFPAGLTAADAIDADYTYFTGLIAQAQKVVDGDKADRTAYPGYRGAGVLIRVKTPTVVQLIVRANITVLAGYSQTAVARQVISAISAYINGLGISEDVILNELRERAMSVPGMYDLAFMAPVSNYVILDDQIARLVSSNISIS